MTTAIQIVDAMEILGLRTDHSSLEQMRVFVEAMEIFSQRNAVHEDLWEKYGWRDNLMHVRSKLSRSVQQANKGENDQCKEETLDALNYMVFFLRNVLEGNPGLPDDDFGENIR